MIHWGIGIAVLVLIVFFATDFVGNDFNAAPESPEVDSTPVVPKAEVVTNYQKYNIDYMRDDIKAILVKKLGASGRTAFYLPATEYMNVSRGTKYGVAFAIQNVNPEVPKGNEFAYNFDVDPAVAGSCGVSISEAQSWIERGWASSGMISGQWREDWNEWHDAMTIYFAFPSDVEPCNIKYNFVISRDGAAYDSKILEFNLI